MKLTIWKKQARDKELMLQLHEALNAAVPYLFHNGAHVASRGCGLDGCHCGLNQARQQVNKALDDAKWAVR